MAPDYGKVLGRRPTHGDPYASGGRGDRGRPDGTAGHSRTSGPASTELNHLAQHASAKLLLNVAGLEYVSSAGLRAILVAAKLADVNGGALKVCDANPAVQHVMEVSGMHSLLHLHATEAEALAAFE